jgi:hypothetical protein
VHGGFEPETPNIPTDIISVIDCYNLFQNYPHLLPKYYLEEQKQQINENISTNENIGENNNRAVTPNMISDIDCEVKMSESCFVINIDDDRDQYL